jgi:hypothetical protein
MKATLDLTIGNAVSVKATVRTTPAGLVAAALSAAAVLFPAALLAATRVHFDRNEAKTWSFYEAVVLRNASNLCAVSRQRTFRHAFDFKLDAVRHVRKRCRKRHVFRIDVLIYKTFDCTLVVFKSASFLC